MLPELRHLRYLLAVADHGSFTRAAECDLKILHLAVDGHVVLIKRFDHWIVNGKPIDTPVMGTYEVKNQKITAWIDAPVMGANSIHFSIWKDRPVPRYIAE